MKSSERLKIYVAGPYTDTDLKALSENVNRAIDAGLQIWKKGHYPFIPHLTHFVDLRAREKSIEMDWSDYLDWDEPWLESCDALLYLGSSKGADRELSAARSAGLMIFRSLDDIPSVKSQPAGPDQESDALNWTLLARSSTVYVGFIDLLFAVVVGVSFTLLDKIQLDPFSNWFQLSALLLMYVLVATSWYGYKFSTLRVPTTLGQWVIEIAMLFVYYAGFVAVSDLKPPSLNLQPILEVFVATFVLYVAWNIVRLLNHRKGTRYVEFRNRLTEAGLFALVFAILTITYPGVFNSYQAYAPAIYPIVILALLILYRVRVQTWRMLASRIGKRWENLRSRRKS